MKIEVVSALPHSTVHQAVLSRKHQSIICAGPYEILPLETCFEPLPSTSSLAHCAIECLGLSKDERNIGVATNALLKIADLETGREIRNLTGHTAPITSLARSEFSVFDWYTGSSDFSWSHWDMRVHPSRVLGARTTGVVRSLALSPGDRFVAIGTDHSIQLFDARQRQIVKQFNCSGHRLEFHPTEVLLSSVGHDRIVRFFCLESLEMISQSDPFLDDIQASAFDSHLMVTATDDYINLLTWEPCDVYATVPLKNVDKVVNICLNSGGELDLICIGENTERLEMRSFSMEELLTYSPSHELSGSIYEEDESDISPIEEEKAPLAESPTSKSEIDMPSTSPSFSSSSDVNSPTASTNESGQSSPSSPVKEKPRTLSRMKTRALSNREAETTSKSATSSLAGKRTESLGRSVTPVVSKPPSSSKTLPASHPRSSSIASKPSLRTKPSPSMTNLAAKSSLCGSTQSLNSERDPKKRSASAQRNTETFTITYMGRPKSPSEHEVAGKAKYTLPIPASSLSRRKASPAVKSPTSKVVRKKADPPGKSAGFIIDGLDDFENFTQKVVKGHDKLRRMAMKKGRDVLISKDVQNDEDLLSIATNFISLRNEWSLNTCHAYLQTFIDNVTSAELDLQSGSLAGLDAIANTMLDKLVKFSNANSRIGVDVVAEERAEKAKECIDKLRGMCEKRDWYYKQLDSNAVERLDAIFERLKVL